MSKPRPEKYKVLFVCFANICRSPIAEGVFKKTVTEMGVADQWEIDSAGLNTPNIGSSPDRRALETMRRHNVSYNNVSRKLTTEDFNYYDFIMGMDNGNMQTLARRAPPHSKAKLFLFGEFGPESDKRSIRDPFDDTDETGFEECYEKAVVFTKGFLEALRKGEIE